MPNQVVSREECLKARVELLAAGKETAGACAASGNAAASGAADWLSLAAAPTFAIMALLTGVGGTLDMLCLAAQDASPLSGMVLMYLLMSAFHAAPWLTLISRRRVARIDAPRGSPAASARAAAVISESI